MTDNLPPADEMLDFLQAKTGVLNLWVCRRSFTRGWRLHEASPHEVATYEWDAHATVRQAIAAAMGKEPK